MTLNCWVKNQLKCCILYDFNLWFSTADNNGDTRGIEVVSTCCFCHKTSIGKHKNSKHYDFERDERSNSNVRDWTMDSSELARIHRLNYMPFGIAPGVWAGQNFAIVELKVIVSLVVSRFDFSLSPSYNHSPAFRLVLEPENGVILHLRKL